MGSARYSDSEGTFTLAVPEGWEVEKDEEGGLLVSHPEGSGLLHLIPFARDPVEVIDPAEELYAFLEDQEIELEEDEVEVLELAAGGLLALSEYGTEEAEETIYWMVGVVAGPGQLVFASYSCPADEDEAERSVARGILTSLAFEVEEPDET